MKFFDQAKALISKNSSKVTGQLGGLGKMIDKKTGGKYTDKINKVTSTVEDKLDDLAETDTDIDLKETIDTDAAAKRVSDAADKATDTATNGATKANTKATDTTS